MKIKHISINNYLGIEELDISLNKDKIFIVLRFKVFYTGTSSMIVMLEHNIKSQKILEVRQEQQIA